MIEPESNPQEESRQFASAFFHLSQSITKNDETVHGMIRRMTNLEPPEGMPDLTIGSIMAAALYLDQNPEEVNNPDLVNNFFRECTRTFDRFLLMHSPPGPADGTK